ncbi:hypothetical protein KsCSTR_15530 [Candidatus Kuenenia stuttgartiensis]|uniref:Uncharacterized protein n=1 Tax=Kuenenia stuttgartiensis TaxID=174633 RepID=Q1Q1L7_KUEST|nr:hypothetical protein KsCSTR_15530 [Candidatus Kuenenia stuttgartiensis]CAJ73909.1 unknown protein [Candidatus Kuenenia stuttgartiensis]
MYHKQHTPNGATLFFMSTRIFQKTKALQRVTNFYDLVTLENQGKHFPTTGKFLLLKADVHPCQNA